MTHSNEFKQSLPYTRKKLNAAFLHRLKKLCVVFHHHVKEILGDDERGDVVSVHLKREDAKKCILDLCEAYGIGDEYIDLYANEWGNGEYIDIYLSQKKL